MIIYSTFQICIPCVYLASKVRAFLINLFLCANSVFFVVELLCGYGDVQYGVSHLWSLHLGEREPSCLLTGRKENELSRELRQMPMLHRLQTIKTSGLNFEENVFFSVIFSNKISFPS